MAGNTTDTGTRARPGITENKELKNEPHKPLTRTYMKRKVNFSFGDNTWEVDLPNMQLIKKYNEELDFSCKYWYLQQIHLGCLKKVLKLRMHCKRLKIILFINRKKILLDQGSQFYTNHWNCGCMDIVLKCIQYTTKKNLLLLKELSELWKATFITKWLQYQRICTSTS